MDKEIEEKEKSFNEEDELKNRDKVVTFTKYGRKYYSRRIEAERVRRQGQVIRYSSKYNAYYIIKNIKKRSFWVW